MASPTMPTRFAPFGVVMTRTSPQRIRVVSVPSVARIPSGLRTMRWFPRSEAFFRLPKNMRHRMTPSTAPRMQPSHSALTR